MLYSCHALHKLSIEITENDKEDVPGGLSLKARLVTMARKALQVESSSQNEDGGKVTKCNCILSLRFMNTSPENLEMMLAIGLLPPAYLNINSTRSSK